MKLIKRTIAALIALLLISSPALAMSTTYTYTVSTKYTWTKTQDAYIPEAVIFQNIGLSAPQDIFIAEGHIYIADTGNSRVLKINPRDYDDYEAIGEGILQSPMGLWVTGERLYVCDNMRESVLVFEDGELIREHIRPDTLSFGTSNPFKPIKVAVDSNGSIFILSEGAFDGIIQISDEGEFLGYFGANNVKQSLWDRILRIVLAPEQVAKMFNLIPQSLTNIALDKDGMVCSITQTKDNNAVKKYNIEGENILQNSVHGGMATEVNFSDIIVGRYNQIYCVSESGVIYEYDENGALMFAFGGRSTTNERNGLFTVVSGIAVDENDRLFVLDKERAIVQIFSPTVFANLYHQGIDLFARGEYERGKQVWQEVLKYDSMSQRAHNGLGMMHYNSLDYEKAADSFKTAGNRQDYSDAFWQLRDKFIQQNAAYFILALFALGALSFILKLLDKRFRILNFWRGFKGAYQNTTAYKRLKMFRRVSLHPIDAYYDLKLDNSIWFSSCIYVAAFIVFAAYMVGRSYLYAPYQVGFYTPFYIFSLFFAPVALWVLGNYMVSTISEGEGSLRQVFCCTAYAFAPFVIFMPFVIASTYIFTYNEAFVVDTFTAVIVACSGLNLFLMVKEVHDYSLRDTIKNVLITLFFMAVTVIVIGFFYIFIDKLIDFVYSFVMEVIGRG